MALQALAQQRAKHAWQAAERNWKQAGKGEDYKTSFAQPCKEMPMRIRTAGLAQTLAFLIAKEQGLAVLGSIADWCHRRAVITNSEPQTLLTESLNRDAAWLRYVTAEVMAYLEWLVRFSESFAKQEETDARAPSK